MKKYVTLHTPVSPEIANEVDRMASIVELKRTELVRNIIIEYIENNKDYYNQIIIDKLKGDWYEDPKERHKTQKREWARKNAVDPTSKPS